MGQNVDLWISAAEFSFPTFILLGYSLLIFKLLDFISSIAVSKVICQPTIKQHTNNLKLIFFYECTHKQNVSNIFAHLPPRLPLLQHPEPQCQRIRVRASTKLITLHFSSRGTHHRVCINMPATAAGGRNSSHSAAQGLQVLGCSSSVCLAERRLNRFAVLRPVEEL